MPPEPPNGPFSESSNLFTDTSQKAADRDSLEPSLIFGPSWNDKLGQRSISDKFLEHEPDSYENSEEITSIFFKEGRTVTYFQAQLIIINESDKFSIPDPQPYSIESILLEEEFNRSIISSKDGEPVKITIFISDSGRKLEYLAHNSRMKLKGAPKDNEVIFFIEADDALSKNVVHIVSGNKVLLNQKNIRSVIRSTTSFSDVFINELLDSVSGGKKSFTDYLLSALSVFSKANEVIYGLIGDGFGLIIELIDKLLIDEKHWNPQPDEKKEEKPNAFLGAIFKGIDATVKTLQQEIKRIGKSVLIPLSKKGRKMKAIASRISVYLNYLSRALGDIAWIHNKLIETIKDLYKLSFSMAKEWFLHNLSLMMGLWNGIVDMFSGFVFLVRMPFALGEFTSKGMTGIIEALKSDKSQEFLEYIDDLIDSLRKQDLKKIFKYALEQLKDLVKDINWESASESIEELGDKVIEGAKDIGGKGIDAVSSLNSREYAYYIGYIATFFIPVAPVAVILGKVGKAGKLLGQLGEAMVWVDDLMLKFFGVAIRGIKTAAKPLALLLKLLKAITKKLSGDLKTIFKMVDDIVLGIRMWLDEMFSSKAFSKLSTVIKNLDLNGLVRNASELIENNAIAVGKSTIKIIDNHLPGILYITKVGYYFSLDEFNETIIYIGRRLDDWVWEGKQGIGSPMMYIPLIGPPELIALPFLNNLGKKGYKWLSKKRGVVPQDFIADLRAHYGKKIIEENNLELLTKMFRIAYTHPFSTNRIAARNELNTLKRLLDDPDVLSIEILQARSGKLGRQTPDFHVTLNNGNSFRNEITTFNRKVIPTKGNLNTPEIDYAKKLESIIRNKIEKNQLGSKIVSHRVLGSPRPLKNRTDIAKGGRLTVEVFRDLPQGTSFKSIVENAIKILNENKMAKFSPGWDNLRSIAGENGKHLHEIEIVYIDEIFHFIRVNGQFILR